MSDPLYNHTRHGVHILQSIPWPFSRSLPLVFPIFSFAVPLRSHIPYHISHTTSHISCNTFPTKTTSSDHSAISANAGACRMATCSYRLRPRLQAHHPPMPSIPAGCILPSVLPPLHLHLHLSSQRCGADPRGRGQGPFALVSLCWRQLRALELS